MNGKLAQIGDMMVNPCVGLLRDMLAQAEAGQLTTCAVIAPLWRLQSSAAVLLARARIIIFANGAGSLRKIETALFR